MFTPDYNGNPELVSEMMKSIDEIAKNFKFRPLALIWKPLHRNQAATMARLVAVRRTNATTLVEEC